MSEALKIAIWPAIIAGLTGICIKVIDKCEGNPAEKPTTGCDKTIVVQNNQQYFEGRRYTYTGRNTRPPKGYETFHFEYSIPKDTNALNDFLNIRAKAYSQAIDEICRKKIAFPLDEQRVSYLNDAANKEDLETIIHPDLDKILIGIYDSVLYDCENQQFICRIGIGYPIQPETFIPELAGFIKGALKQLPLYDSFKNDPLNTDLDLGAILWSFEQDESFMAEYKRIVERHKSLLEILRLSVEKSKGDYSVFFDSGDFRLNPVSMIIIGHIAERYEEIVRNYPKRRFGIVAEGFADGSPVRQGGIPYYRDGRWSNTGEALPFSNGAGQNIGNRIASGDTGNKQLAYARGFEGMKLLQTTLEMSQSSLLRNVQLTYRGTAMRTRANPYERRVSFKIQELE